MNKMVITGVGPDKPGIVAGMCLVLYELGGNIQDCSMTILEKEFAMIMVVSIPQEHTLTYVQQSFASVEKELDMSVLIKSIQANNNNIAPLEKPTPYMISVSGEDRTGITQKVAERLALQKINITNLNAQIIMGENGPVYIMMIEVELPYHLNLQALKTELDSLANALGVEIHIRAIEPLTL